MEKLQRSIEVERIVNIAKGFGWELKETRVEGDVLQIVLEKNVVAAPAA